MRNLLWLIILSLLLSCSSENETRSIKSSPRVRKSSKVVQPKTNQKFLFGDPIPWKIDLKGEASIDSMKIEALNSSITFLGDSGIWVPANPKAGTPKMKLTVYFEGKNEIHYPRIKLIPKDKPTEYTYQVVATYPHDTEAYIQGLFIHNGNFIESTGQRGASSLSEISPESGEILRRVNLKNQYFGEGCTLWKDNIYQLTWESQIGFIYDLEFNQLSTFTYPTEGWGLSTWNDTFVMSDGSANIYLMDPEGFVEKDRLEVYKNEEKISSLNELEVVNGLIYANVYGKENVVMIDPNSGAVVGDIDFGGLRARAASGNGIDYVLNGIAYDEENDRLFVTGKLWNTIFEVELIEKPKTTS